MPTYDEKLGLKYACQRYADPRLVSRIIQGLDLPINSVVLDVGGGTGSYANALGSYGFNVKVVEPSSVMRKQSTVHPRVEWFEGTAEHLPTGIRKTDGVICILSIHHFRDLDQSLRNFDRIIKHGKVLIFTFDPRTMTTPPWLARYFPRIWEASYNAFVSSLTIAEKLEKIGFRSRVETFHIPEDIQDNFIAAGWKRPEIYLSESVRKSMSGFATSDPKQTEAGLRNLEIDLKNGKWQRDQEHLNSLSEIDWGYRFILGTC